MTTTDAPTGWTKLATYNDYMFRVVSNNGTVVNTTGGWTITGISLDNESSHIHNITHAHNNFALNNATDTHTHSISDVTAGYNGTERKVILTTHSIINHDHNASTTSTALGSSSQGDYMIEFFMLLKLHTIITLDL